MRDDALRLQPVNGPAPKRALWVGTAGWSVPNAVATHFPVGGSHLERYSAVFPCTEINSSFYRAHARKTYEKWAGQTPAAFQFSVKLPRAVTHEQRLRATRPLLEALFEQVAGLGSKLGAVLVQLPPSLAFERDIAAEFFESLRALYDGAVVLEPRHVTWFDAPVDTLLNEHGVARVTADPPVITAPVCRASPSGSPVFAYWRLHGSPKMYWSRYSPESVEQILEQVRALRDAIPKWCVFDNTAAGAAAENALEMLAAASPASEE